MTTLRAQGYAFSRDYAGADIVLVNTCGFLDSAKQESLEAIGEALAENGRVIVTGCLGVEEELIRKTHPSVLAVTGPHQYEAVVNAVNAHLPPVPNAFVDLVPRAGPAADAAPLRLSEDFRGLQQSLLVLHHPADPRRPRLAAGGRACCTRPSGWSPAGVKEILVISQDTSAYGVDIKYADEQVSAAATCAAKFHDAGRGTGQARTCGCASTTSTPTRMSTASSR